MLWEIAIHDMFEMPPYMSPSQFHFSKVVLNCQILKALTMFHRWTNSHRDHENDEPQRESKVNE